MTPADTTARTTAACGTVRLPAFLVLLALALVAFAPAFTNSYAYDGLRQMEFLGDQPLGALKCLLDPADYWKTTGILCYRPLHAAVFLVVDVHLFHKIPGFSHGLNILIHVLNCWLMFRIARWHLARCGVARAHGIALGAAMIPLVHPIMSGTVLCANFRIELVAALGVLLALNLCVRWLDAGTGGWRSCLIYGMGFALCCLLGVSYKETGAICVLVAPAFLLLTGGRVAWRKALVAGTGAFAAAASYYLVWRHFKSPNFCPELFCNSFPMAPTLNFLTSISEVYLRLLVVPWPLRAWYPFDCLSGPDDPRLWIALAKTGAVLAAGVAIGMRSRIAAFALLWAVTAFVPVSQIIAIPDRIAERFCYQPMFCIGLTAAAGFALLVARFPRTRRLTVIFYALLVAAWTLLTHIRAYDWKDNPTLLLANWEETGDTRPEGLSISASIYLNRAGERGRRGDLEGRDDDLARARIKIRRLMEIEPENPDGHRLAAVLQLHLRNRKAAALHAAEALQLAPEDPEVRDTARRSGIALDTAVTTAPR